MKIIAFKRASNSALHSQLITEWGDASLLPSTDGYETMIEEHFQLELAKNPQRQAEHDKYLKEQSDLAKQAEKQSRSVRTKIDKELEREYQRFKAWQRHSGNK